MTNRPSTAYRLAVTAFCLLQVPLVLLVLPAFGIGNVLVDERTAGLLRNTYVLSLSTCVLAIPPGATLAFLLTRTDVAGRRAAIVVLGTMLFVPLYLQAAGWDAGFGRQGWLSLSQGTLAAPLLAGWRAAVWIHTLAALPWVVLIVGIRLRYAAPELEDAAALDASTLQVIWLITLRQGLPAVFVAVLWICVTTAGEMTITDLYQVRTYAEEIYSNVPSYGEFTSHGLAALPGMVALGCLILWGFLAACYVVPPPRVGAPQHPRTISLHRWRWPASAFVLVAVLLVAGVPLANLGINAGMTVREEADGPSRVWTVAKFLSITVTSPWRFVEEFCWTNVIGLVVGATAVLNAGLLGWLARQRRFFAGLAILPTTICLALPGPMVGLSVIWLLNRERFPLLIWLYDHSILAPCLATLVRAFPIAMLITWFSLRTIPADELDAASTEGAGIWQRLLYVGLPQRKLALASAGLAAMVIAAGDLSASILVTPPGVSTVPVRVFGLLHAGVDDQVAGLCLAMVGEFVVLATLTMALLRRQENRVRDRGASRV